MSKLCNLLIRLSLLFLIIYTPLAFACTEPWALAIMEWVAVAMGMVWVLKMLVTGRLRYVKNPLNLPILLFLLWTAFQIVPLPPHVLEAISPVTHELYTKYAAGYAERGTPERTEAKGEPLRGGERRKGKGAKGRRVAEGEGEKGKGRGDDGSSKSRAPTDENRILQFLNPPNSQSSQIPRSLNPDLPISIYPYATRMKILEFLSYAIVFFVIVNTAGTRRQLLSWVIVPLIAVGSFEAFFNRDTIRLRTEGAPGSVRWAIRISAQAREPAAAVSAMPTW